MNIILTGTVKTRNQFYIKMQFYSSKLLHPFQIWFLREWLLRERKKKRKKEKKINAFLFIVRYQKNFFKKRGRSASLITVRMQGISTKRRGGEKKKWKIKITQTVLFQMFIQGQIDLSKSEKYLYTK